MADDDSENRRGGSNVRNIDEYRGRGKRSARSWRRGIAALNTAKNKEPETEAPRFPPTPLRDAIRRYLYLKERSRLVERAMQAIPAWITPNGITLFRGLLIVPIVLLLQASLYWWALPVLGIAFFLDFVDGALAHARKQHTTFGAFMDPVMDKVLICGSLLALMPVLDEDFRTLITASVIFAIAITGVRILKMCFPRWGRGSADIKAGFVGKLKFNVEVVSVLCVVLSLALHAPWLLSAAFLTLFLSVVLAFASLLTQFLALKKSS